VAEEDKQDEAVREGCSLEHTRWRDDGEERWWLDLGVRVEEGEGELKSEGERCGVLRGWSSPFIGTGGASGRRQWAVTSCG
jgi:hypothetical protein